MRVLKISWKSLEEWHSKLKCCVRIRRFQVQSSLGTWSGLGKQPCYNNPVTSGSTIDKMQWLTSGERDCLLNPNLSVGEGDNFTPPRSFSLNNWETVKAVTLAFCSIQQHFIRKTCAKFGISYSSQSPDIGQNSDEGISDFQIPGQSLIKGNCQNSRTSDDINMELGPVTKLDKRNKTTSKKLTMTSCRKIVTSLTFFQFTAFSEQSGRRILDA